MTKKDRALAVEARLIDGWHYLPEEAARDMHLNKAFLAGRQWVVALCGRPVKVEQTAWLQASKYLPPMCPDCAAVRSKLVKP